MENRNYTQNELDLDTGILSNFIIELNIALRLITSYPKKHPVISASIQKVSRLLENLLEFKEEVAIGVARDALMVGYKILDPKNPVYRNLAKVLFDHDIAAIIFNRRTTSDDLLNFSELMSCKREEIRGRGGIRKLAAVNGICNIQVKEIDYGYFRTTEEERIPPVGTDAGKNGESGIWENFVHGLLDGTLDPNGISAAFSGSLEPGVLADMMNDLDDHSHIKVESYSQTIASFISELDNGESNEGSQNESIEKFSSFVNRLNPELRRQFLNGTFTCLEPEPRLAERIMDKFSDEIILDVLEGINSCMACMSPLIVNLLQRLSKSSAEDTRRRTTAPVGGDEDRGQLREKLGIIFREDEWERFVPDAYQRMLQAISSTDRISIPELEDMEELRQTLSSHSVETQICRIILEIMRGHSEESLSDALERNLLELVDYLLEMGDFSFLARVYGQLSDARSRADNFSGEGSFRLVEIFSDKAFVEKVLNGLDTWGKSKYNEIREFVCMIGSPFVEPMLERLADERNMTLRRFFMDCLMDQGDSIRDAVISRLGDKRWYFVRNLIIILRKLDDPSILKHLRRLRNDSHAKIRQEVIRTFQHFRHPEADDFLIQDLCGTDRELQANAVQLADKSRDPEVFDRLLTLLNRRVFAFPDYEIKIAIVRTLAQIKNSEALPVLMQIIGSKNILRPNAHGRLKAEVASSLDSYPAETVKQLLDKLPDSGRSELARLARETRKHVQDGR